MATLANIPADGEPPFYAGTTHEIWGVVFRAGTPMDITNATIVWILSPAADTAPIEVKTTADNTQIKIVDPLGGVFVVYIKPVDTATLGGTAPYHEARAAILGIEEVLFAGILTISESNTQGLL
jgi:hypothetical protein